VTLFVEHARRQPCLLPSFLLCLPALHSQASKVLQQSPLPPGIQAGPQLVLVPALSNHSKPASHLVTQVNHLLHDTAIQPQAPLVFYSPASSAAVPFYSLASSFLPLDVISICCIGYGRMH
jgi:hypothetical protein